MLFIAVNATVSLRSFYRNVTVLVNQKETIYRALPHFSDKAMAIEGSPHLRRPATEQPEGKKDVNNLTWFKFDPDTPTQALPFPFR